MRICRRDGKGPLDLDGHFELPWNVVNPRRGVYDWSGYHAALESSERVHFGLLIATSTPAGSIDQSPRWAGRSYSLSKNTTMPAYDNEGWQAALRDLILAFGREFNGKVASVWIGLGVDGELQPVKERLAQDRLASVMSRDDLLKTYLLGLEWFREAFPDTPLLLQAGTGFGAAWGVGAWRDRRDLMTRAFDLGIGYKMNGLAPDKENAVGHKKAEGWEAYDLADRCKALGLPVAFEFAHTIPDDKSDPVQWRYWSLHAAAFHGADFVSMQWPWIKLDPFDHLRIDFNSRWVVFREAEFPKVEFTHSGMSGDPRIWSSGLNVTILGDFEILGNDGSWYGRQALSLPKGSTLSVSDLEGLSNVEIIEKRDGVWVRTTMQTSELEIRGPRVVHKIAVVPRRPGCLFFPHF